jgi:hypothetical protein
MRRAAALEAAAQLPYPHASTRQLARLVLDAAEIFETWLVRTNPVAAFTITADTPADRPDPEGADMSLTFPDTQQDTLRITGAVDAEGAAVTDTFTWTVDNTAVLTLTPAADTMSCLIVPGTVAGPAVVTATASDGVTRTFAIDVTTGPTAAFAITSDGPVDRPAAPAPAAGA